MMVTCKSTAEEVSLEWSHHRISLKDSKVRNILCVSIIDAGSEFLLIVLLHYLTICIFLWCRLLMRCKRSEFTQTEKCF